MMTTTLIQIEKAEVVKYLVRAMCYYKDKKEMLIVPYTRVAIGCSLQFQWGTIRSGTVTPIGRQIQLLASEEPVITVRLWLSLMSKFILHFSFFIVSSLHDNFALKYEYNVSV
jgi:hypothetical protein